MSHRKKFSLDDISPKDSLLADQPSWHRGHSQDIQDLTGYDQPEDQPAPAQGRWHQPAQRCYHTHPALVFVIPPESKYNASLEPIECRIYGGSCIDPAVKDADIYIGHDYGMRKFFSDYPWEVVEGQKLVQEIKFEIPDMNPPGNPVQFKKMIKWLIVQLIAGKKVHVGCIGGHGRTGMTFSALVAEATGELDAVTYVRKHYCVKAVESRSQVKFLMKHFGISAVDGAKEGSSGFGQGSLWPAALPQPTTKEHSKSAWASTASHPTTVSSSKGSKHTTFGGSISRVYPVSSRKSLFNLPLPIDRLPELR